LRMDRAECAGILMAVLKMAVVQVAVEKWQLYAGDCAGTELGCAGVLSVETWQLCRTGGCAEIQVGFAGAVVLWRYCGCAEVVTLKV